VKLLLKESMYESYEDFYQFWRRSVFDNSLLSASLARRFAPSLQINSVV